MHNAFRTPSPEKTDSEGNRKHSPWTAQRARKKGRSSPDLRLPGVRESQLEESLVPEGKRQSPTRSATDLALHLAQNPFLGNEGFEVRLGEGSLQGLSQRVAHQNLAFLSSKEPQVPLDLPYLGQSTTSSSRLHQADRPSGSLRAQPTFSNPIVSAGSVHPIICTFAREEGVELIGCGTRSQKGANALRETAVVLPSLALSGQQFVPALSMRPIDEPAQTMDESASPDSEGSLKPLARHESGQNVKGSRVLDLQRAGGLCSPCSPKSQLEEERTDVEASKKACSSGPSLRRPPLQEMTPGQSASARSVAPTPSPGVPAPGLRLDGSGQGRAPPRVSTSCRTIRRVLINSPQSSQGRPWSAEDSRAPMSVDKDILEALPLSSASTMVTPQEVAVNGINPCEAEFYHYGTNLTWMTATPETADDSEGDFMDNVSQSALDCESPTFVLAKGHITPNNLLPGWDDEGEGPWGPRKGYYSPPVRRSSGQIATFDERLHEAIQNGDAVTLGQAWRDVKSGNVKPDDIDTLNTLLNCYCKVEGDPVEAEEIVKEACKDGRLLPNASTYHHMTALWTRHEQLNNSA